MALSVCHIMSIWLQKSAHQLYACPVLSSIICATFKSSNWEQKNLVDQPKVQPRFHSKLMATKLEEAGF